MQDDIGCGIEQVAVLPVLGVVCIGVLLYIFCVTWKAVRKRAHLDRLLRSALQEAADEAIALQAQQTEASGIAKSVTEALQEGRVLVLDLSEYHSARAQWRCVSKMFMGACLVAAAQPGSTDFIYSGCRMLVLALLWVQHEGSTAALQGGAVLAAEHFGTAYRGLGTSSRISLKNGLKQPSKIPVGLAGLRRISRCAAWKYRAGLWVVHTVTLAVLIFFEAYRHPILQEEACPDDGGRLAALPMLLAERSAALTLFTAWMLAILSYASLLECEACIWLAPKAGERIGGLLQANRRGSFSMGRGLQLAEAICGAAGPQLADALVRELHEGYGVTVLCEGVALVPKPLADSAGRAAAVAPQPPPSQGDAEEFAAFRRELQGEVRRSLNLSENRISEVLKSNEAMVKAMECHLESASTADTTSTEKKPHHASSSPVENFTPEPRSQSLVDKASDRSLRRERRSSRRSVIGRSADNGLSTHNVAQQKRDVGVDVQADQGAGVGNVEAGSDTAPVSAGSPTTETVRENLRALQQALSEAGQASPASKPPRLDLADSPDKDEDTRSRTGAASSQPLSNFGPRPRPSQSSLTGRRRVSERATPPRQSRPAASQSPLIAGGSPSPVMVRETPPPQPVGSRVARPSQGRTSMRGGIERDQPERLRGRPPLRGVMNGGAANGDEHDELERLRSELGGDEPPDAMETPLGFPGAGSSQDFSERRFASRPRPSMQGRRASAARDKDQDHDESVPVPRRSVGFRDEDSMELHENPDWPISMF